MGSLTKLLEESRRSVEDLKRPKRYDSIDKSRSDNNRDSSRSSKRSIQVIDPSKEQYQRQSRTDNNNFYVLTDDSSTNSDRPIHTHVNNNKDRDDNDDDNKSISSSHSRSTNRSGSSTGISDMVDHIIKTLEENKKPSNKSVNVQSDYRQKSSSSSVRDIGEYDGNESGRESFVRHEDSSRYRTSSNDNNSDGSRSDDRNGEIDIDISEILNGSPKNSKASAQEETPIFVYTQPQTSGLDLLTRSIPSDKTSVHAGPQQQVGDQFYNGSSFFNPTQNSNGSLNTLGGTFSPERSSTSFGLGNPNVINGSDNNSHLSFSQFGESTDAFHPNQSPFPNNADYQQHQQRSQNQEQKNQNQEQKNQNQNRQQLPNDQQVFMPSNNSNNSQIIAWNKNSPTFFDVVSDQTVGHMAQSRPVDPSYLSPFSVQDQGTMDLPQRSPSSSRGDDFTAKSLARNGNNEIDTNTNTVYVDDEQFDLQKRKPFTFDSDSLYYSDFKTTPTMENVPEQSNTSLKSSFAHQQISPALELTKTDKKQNNNNEKNKDDSNKNDKKSSKSSDSIVWYKNKNIILGILIAIVVGLIAFYIFIQWKKRRDFQPSPLSEDDASRNNASRQNNNNISGYSNQSHDNNQQNQDPASSFSQMNRNKKHVRFADYPSKSGSGERMTQTNAVSLTTNHHNNNDNNQLSSRSSSGGFIRTDVTGAGSISNTLQQQMDYINTKLNRDIDDNNNSTAVDTITPSSLSSSHQSASPPQNNFNRGTNNANDIVGIEFEKPMICEDF